jgi:hypothetical protein
MCVQRRTRARFRCYCKVANWLLGSYVDISAWDLIADRRQSMSRSPPQIVSAGSPGYRGVNSVEPPMKGVFVQARRASSNCSVSHRGNGR